jgi:nicotinamide-nucleotide amidase
MPIRKRLEILSLGDEFLLGLRDNAHLSYIGKELARKGLSIARDQELRDNADEIKRYFLETWKQADIVITIGGLGPTDDDITRESIAAALGLKLVRNESVVASITERLGKVDRTPTEVHLRQAMIPEGAEVLPNNYGTAPGIWLEKDGKILIMLPGAGTETRPMFMEEVLPRFEVRDIALINDAYLQLRTCGLAESDINSMLAPVLVPYEGRVYSCISTAFTGMVDVRIGPKNETDWKTVEEVGDRCRETLGAYFLGYGDVNLAEVISRKLRDEEKTISVAESCTGGLLCSAFADVPGASKIFRGGVVCYNNDIKEEMLDVPEPILLQHGAVSAETAVALAIGAQERLASDYAISVTGYAGPSGGSGTMPVGTVFIGFASPEGAWSLKVFLDGTRQAVRERAVMLALDWSRHKLFKLESTPGKSGQELQHTQK